MSTKEKFTISGDKLVEKIKQREDVAFVLVLGDITDFGLAAEFEWVCKALSALDVPRFYVIGNHDSISFGKEIFRENFAPYDYAFSFKEVIHASSSFFLPENFLTVNFNNYTA